MQKFYDSQIEVEDIYNRVKLYRDRLIKLLITFQVANSYYIM